MSMNVKSPGPPFIFGVKKCDPSLGSSQILLQVQDVGLYKK